MNIEKMSAMVQEWLEKEGLVAQSCRIEISHHGRWPGFRSATAHAVLQERDHILFAAEISETGVVFKNRFLEIRRGVYFRVEDIGNGIGQVVAQAAPGREIISLPTGCGDVSVSLAPNEEFGVGVVRIRIKRVQQVPGMYYTVELRSYEPGMPRDEWDWLMEAYKASTGRNDFDRNFDRSLLEQVVFLTEDYGNPLIADLIHIGRERGLQPALKLTQLWSAFAGRDMPPFIYFGLYDSTAEDDSDGIKRLGYSFGDAGFSEPLVHVQCGSDLYDLLLQIISNQ